VETEKSVPSFGAVNAAAKAAEESAYRAAAAAAERLRTSEDEASGTKPATSAGAGGTWAQRPGSKGPGAGSAGAGNAGNAGNTKPSPKVHPERDGFNAGRARRSNPNAEGAGMVGTEWCSVFHLLVALEGNHQGSYLSGIELSNFSLSNLPKGASKPSSATFLAILPKKISLKTLHSELVSYRRQLVQLLS